MGRGLQSCPERSDFGFSSTESHISVSRGLAWQYVVSWHLAGVTHLHWKYNYVDNAGCLPYYFPGRKAEAFQRVLLYTSTDDNSRRCHLSARQYNVLLHSTWISHVGPRLGHADL